MTHSPSASLRRPAGDDGFTLVEVIVALVLLGIVATAGLYFFIEGTRTTTHLQRTQNAVAVANEAMERAFAVNPKDDVVTHVPGLVTGRTQADVEAAFTAMQALGVEGVDETYPVWDTSPALIDSSGAVLPITYTTKHSRQTYEVTTLVGVCFRASDAVATDQACTTLSGHTTDPGDAGTPAGMVRMLRVTAVVTWPPTAGSCGGGTCSYQLSGLVDRSSDLDWNQVIVPVAVDDFVTMTMGETKALDVLTNDLVGHVTSNPVAVVNYPASGEGTVSTPASNGVITYKAPVNSGHFTFTYRIRDARGTLSNTATVQVTVYPEAVADSVKVMSGTSTSLAVTANDKGSVAGVTITQPPTKGTAVVSGTSVVYTPAAGVTSGGDSFRYTVTDGAGLSSGEATVTILIDHVTAMDHTVTIPFRADGAPDQWTPLTATLLQGNSDTSGIRIVVVDARPALGSLRLDGSQIYAGTSGSASPLVSTVEYSPPAGTAGEWTFRYKLTRNNGASFTDVRTVTLRTAPLAVADTLGSYAAGATHALPVGLNDGPTVFTDASGVTVQLADDLTDKCGQMSPTQDRLANGEVMVDLKGMSGGKTSVECSFTYTLTGRTNVGLRSETVAVAFTMVPGA